MKVLSRLYEELHLSCLLMGGVGGEQKMFNVHFPQTISWHTTPKNLPQNGCTVKSPSEEHLVVLPVSICGWHKLMNKRYNFLPKLNINSFVFLSRLTLMRWTSCGQCLVLDDDSESDERAVDFVSLSRWATSFRSHHNFSFASKLFFFQMKNEVLLVSLNNIQRFWRKLIAFFKYFVCIDAFFSFSQW